MKRLSFKNVNLPTSAKWSKIGIICVSVSAFIASYALTSNNQIIGFIGLGFGVLGTIISTMTK